MLRTIPRPPVPRKPRDIRRVPKTETLLVLVPGVGTLDPEKWHDDTGEQWYQAIAATVAPGMAVFAFPHGLSTSDNDLWWKLIEAGDLFLKDLFWLIEHEKIAHCPIIVAAHSLGGLIVKELVEEQAVKSGAEVERVIGLDTDHRSLCNIDVRDRGFDELASFLKADLEDARLNIYADRAPTVLDTWTTVDENEFGVLSLENSTTQQDSGTASNSDPLSTWVRASSQGIASELAIEQRKPENETAHKSPTFPLFIMPIAKNKDFFGRDTYLGIVEKAFFDQSPTEAVSVSSEVEGPKTFAVYGPGGMGKTELAAKFVYAFQDRFDAIFWIHADKAAKVADGFNKIATELGLVEDGSPDARDPVVIREQVKRWLKDPLKGGSHCEDRIDSSASWLIVFDNVDDMNELEDYWPLDGPGCVLFTSRDPYAKDAQWARNGVELKPFEVEESSFFLSKITRKKDEDGTAVATILGGLPLAMRQMAAWIVRQGLSFSDFVKTYEEEESHQELFDQKLRRKSRGSYYGHNIATVWALDSLRHGGVLLDTIAFLDPDGIHEKILNTNAQVVALADYPRTSTTYQRARAELLHSSIVSKANQGERLTVHRLVQDAARSRMSQERYHTMLTTAIALISSIWPYEAFGWRHGVARWRVCEELFPHIMKFKDLSRHVQPPLGSNSDDFEFVRLMNDAGWYHHENGNSSEAAEFFNLAQKVAEVLKQINPTPDASPIPKLDMLLAEIHHNLGCVGTETNDPENTLAHFTAFKDIMLRHRTEAVEGSGFSVAIAYNELGNAWMLNKEWEHGEKCFLDSIACAKEEANEEFDPTSVSFPMVNLGLAYWMTLRFDEAVKTIEQGLKDREDKFGADDRDSFITGRFLHALGNVKKSLGFLNESRDLHQRALNQYLSTIGGNHHRTGDLHVKVAEHNLRNGEYDEAESHLTNALRIFENRRHLRQEHCRALFKRSLVLDGRGEHEAAGRAKGDCWVLFRELYPRATTAIQDLTEDDVDDIVAFWSR